MGHGVSRMLIVTQKALVCSIFAGRILRLYCRNVLLPSFFSTLLRAAERPEVCIFFRGDRMNPILWAEFDGQARDRGPVSRDRWVGCPVLGRLAPV